MEIVNEIKKLNPVELEKIKEFISIVLTDKKYSRLTNLEYITKNYIPLCKINPEHKVKKNGHKNGTQRYYCKDCKKSWTITSNKIVRYSSLNYNQFKKLLKGIYDFKSLKDIAKEIGISTTSAFELEIRIFNELNTIFNNCKLKECIQVDEKYIRISFKGNNKHITIPRKSRKSGNDNLVSGISEDQLCIIVAIDSYDKIVIKVAGNGPASTEMIENALSEKIEGNSLLITDSKTSYIKFAENHNLNLIQIPHGEHSYEGYHLNDVNEIMTEISSYLMIKRGISARHLQHHMNFIMYHKIIKYTVDYLETNEKMYIDTMAINISLKSNSVYSTNMPFDLEEYKNWCMQHDL